MLEVKDTVVQPVGIINNSSIIIAIRGHLEMSGFDDFQKQHVLDSSETVIQKFIELLTAYQYDGRYYIVAQKIQQFKMSLAAELEKQKTDGQIAKCVRTAWVHICEVLANSSYYANPELQFATKYLQAEVSILCE